MLHQGSDPLGLAIDLTGEHQGIVRVPQPESDRPIEVFGHGCPFGVDDTITIHGGAQSLDGESTGLTMLRQSSRRNGEGEK